MFDCAFAAGAIGHKNCAAFSGGGGGGHFYLGCLYPYHEDNHFVESIIWTPHFEHALGVCEMAIYLG